MPDSYTEILKSLNEDSYSKKTSEAGITSTIKSRENRKIPGILFR